MTTTHSPLQTLDDLFRFLFEHEQTVVFTNLGRKPPVVFELLNRDYSNMDVAVVSPYYPFPTRGRIHACSPDHLAETRCDLLLYVEPLPHMALVKPPHASRMVILTSHMVFPRSPDALLVSYFHFPAGRTLDQWIQATRSLASVRDVSVQAHNAHHVTVDHSDARVLAAEGGDGTDTAVGYAIVDLTRYTSKVRAYLAFWDVFDRLLDLRHRQSEADESLLRGWLACFNEKSKGYRAFQQFTQDVLDTLYCVRRFEHGNVLELNQLLALLPFYQSGIVEPPLQLTKETFGGVEYVVPQTELELYQACSKLNLKHMVGSVYRIDDSY